MHTADTLVGSKLPREVRPEDFPSADIAELAALRVLSGLKQLLSAFQVRETARCLQCHRCSAAFQPVCVLPAERRSGTPETTLFATGMVAMSIVLSLAQFCISRYILHVMDRHIHVPIYRHLLQSIGTCMCDLREF
jgi:hypothetical protein